MGLFTYSFRIFILLLNFHESHHFCHGHYCCSVPFMYMLRQNNTLLSIIYCSVVEQTAALR